MLCFGSEKKPDLIAVPFAETAMVMSRTGQWEVRIFLGGGFWSWPVSIIGEPLHPAAHCFVCRSSSGRESHRSLGGVDRCYG